MFPPSLSFAKIGPESDPVLREVFQYYLHDMAEWFEVETGPDGSYVYDTSAIWEKGYGVYLAKVGKSVVGFALVGSARDWLSEGNIQSDIQSEVLGGAYDVHEFFVLRGFRRGGVGQRMAAHIWNEHPGEWLVRVLEANAPAVAFWRTAISGHARRVCKEENRLVNGRPWVFFRFTSFELHPRGSLGRGPEL